ncbi:unc93 [Hyphodiscus hymeniophilus]|uniref:Unc93 n=1 Tax=Hyphodiscus hymeniophilus TaxID=353542 RepID=A0A9P7AXH2_9HELO|nr:unc93 [Hyphodiscus hymeniophilus]
MAEKSTIDSGVPVETSSDAHYLEEPTGDVALPAGWKYRGRRILGVNIPWYASPKVQLGMVAFVCFLCPGMFNALGGMGGGGQIVNTTADNMNTALYSTFAVFGFFGGTFVNRLGVRWTLAFGGIGYCIYAIALLVSVHSTKVGAFNIVAGTLLGVCAGLLWTAQGTIMISYPNESQKGRYFAWFWGIFNMGAVIGGLIPLGQDINIKTNKTVTDGTYIAFIVLMFTGAVLALFLCNATDIVRPDGTRVVLMKNPSWQSEFIGLYETIKFEPFVILLFPMFWSSNWFTTYQVNSVNGARFDTRTKALNSVLYYMAQIIAAGIFGYALDIERVRRSVRAKTVLAVLLMLTMAIWGGGYAYEKKYTRTVNSSGDANYVPTDWGTDGYVGVMFLYFFYGFYDAAWQASVYWFMGALSNSGRRSANYVGFYKGIQSAGAAVMWSLDSGKLSYKSEFISNWVLLSISLLCAAPVIFLKIKDHVTVEEDLIGTDETLADVLPQGHSEKGGLA